MVRSCWNCSPAVCNLDNFTFLTLFTGFLTALSRHSALLSAVWDQTRDLTAEEADPLQRGVAGSNSVSFVLPSSLQPSSDPPRPLETSGWPQPHPIDACASVNIPLQTLSGKKIRAVLETLACRVSKIKDAGVCPRQLLCDAAVLLLARAGGWPGRQGTAGMWRGTGAQGVSHDVVDSGSASSALVPPARSWGALEVLLWGSRPQECHHGPQTWLVDGSAGDGVNPVGRCSIMSGWDHLCRWAR